MTYIKIRIIFDTILFVAGLGLLLYSLLALGTWHPDFGFYTMVVFLLLMPSFTSAIIR